MKQVIFSASILAAVTTYASAALTIQSSNLIGFDATTSAIVDNTGRVLVSNTADATESNGSVFVGTFGSLADSAIQSLGSGSDIAAVFTVAGSVDIGTTAPAGLFDATLNVPGDTSALAGQAIFTVIGNEATIEGSDQFLIYRHSEVNGTGTFVELPSLNGPAIVDASTLSNLVVGEHNNFTSDFGAGDVAAFNLVAIPEPSSTALLGLGGLALILRRRK